MRHLILLLIALPLASFAQEQVYTEYFGAGCNTGTLLTDYLSPIGANWTVTETGFNADGANRWFVSAAENGNSPGNCGSGCGSNPTLHVGAFESLLGSDLGAAYYEGLDGFCDFLPCGSTDIRAESPFIDCSAFADVSIAFNYIEGGNALDNATLWYYDGAAWSQLVDLPKTPICPNGQGEWTAYTIDLPQSANNNYFVKIGFRWQNNDDGEALDPSFAVDNVIVYGEFGIDAVEPSITCPSDTTIYTEEYCYFLGDFESLTLAVDNLDPFPSVTQTPIVETVLQPGIHLISVVAADFAGNANQCSFTLTLIDDDAPLVECPSAISFEAEFGEAGADLEVPLPVATDNCSSSLTFNNDFDANSPVAAFFPVGSTTVTYTVTDPSLNAAQCTVEVVVTVSPVNCCLGDLNCDGAVTVADLLILISDFGCVGNGCESDLDDDSIVGVSDLQLFNQLYLTVCPQ
jgi:hypothetical protein